MSPEAVGFDLATYLERERRAVESALERVLARWDDRLPGRIREAIRYGVTGGGKRIRPILCVTAWRACRDGKDAPDAAYDLGASLELIHAYSLMHDDLPCMDDAELRRGRDTVHRVFGEEVTERAGAALIPVAAATALDAARELGCGEERARTIAGELCRAAGAGGMVGGQALDLLGEGRRLDEGELERLHGLKTGALLSASLRMGALAAGAPDHVREGLERYGRAVGLAFQIADDILDATSTAGELGKEPSDAELEKSTYVALRGLEGAREAGKARVGAALEALESAGVRSPALRELARYVMARRR